MGRRSARATPGLGIGRLHLRNVESWVKHAVKWMDSFIKYWIAVQRGDLFFANLVKQDPSRARQNR